jgi:DNA replication protein DnaC
MANCDQHGEFKDNAIALHGSVREPLCPACAAAKLKDFKESGQNPTAQRALEAFESSLSPRFKRASLENFNTPTAEHKKLIAIANRFVNRFADIERLPGGISLLGEPGVGKTHYAIGIGREIAKMGLTPKYSTVSNVISLVRSSWGENGGESMELSKLIHYDLLILDEVGVQSGSANEKKILCEIIDGRYNLMRPTILISNLDINGVSNYVSERSVSRVLEGGMQLPFSVPSFREVAA